MQNVKKYQIDPLHSQLIDNAQTVMIIRLKIKRCLFAIFQPNQNIRK